MFKRIFAVLLVLTLLASSVFAAPINDLMHDQYDVNGYAQISSKSSTLNTNLTATSPSSAVTAVGATITGIGLYRTLNVTATLTGATGGVLDVYLQVSPDGGTTWVDYAHFAQLAAGASAVSKSFAVSRQAQQLTITTVGTGTSAALAANTVLGGDFTDRMRVLFVGGSSTSAGAVQTILISANT